MEENKDARPTGYSFKNRVLPSITPESTAFLSTYTGIMDTELLIERIKAVWEKSQANLHIYNCVATLRFLKPTMMEFKFPWWHTLTRAISESPQPLRILECGACFGQDMRYLLQWIDALPPSVPRPTIHVTDCIPGYWDLGLELYGDAETLVGPGRKIEQAFFCDMTVSDTRDVKSRGGQYDFIISMAMIHVFSKSQTRDFLKNIHSMLKADSGIFVGFGGGRDKDSKSIPWDDIEIEGKGRYLFNPADYHSELMKAGFGEASVEDIKIPGKEKNDGMAILSWLAKA